MHFLPKEYFQSKNGVPTLQAYRDGQLIGNFVRLSDEFGEDFYADDVESYLKEWVLTYYDWRRRWFYQSIANLNKLFRYGVLSDDPGASIPNSTNQPEPEDDSWSEFGACYYLTVYHFCFTVCIVTLCLLLLIHRNTCNVLLLSQFVVMWIYTTRGIPSDSIHLLKAPTDIDIRCWQRLLT